jgi:misacylated tRNA(Ala) deacylase
MGVTQHGRTHRLDLLDPSLRDWDSTVVWSDPADPEAGIVLDRSAFYPGGGGQPPDRGVLVWQGVQTRIVDTRKGDDLYLVPAPGDPVPPPGTAVRGAIEDDRRSLLMRTHSGLHVLCGVVFRDFGALVTGGTMERIDVRVLPRAEALGLPDIIRTQSNLIPADEEEIRIVDIVGLDVQADGGTHVASTSRVGKVSVVKVESKGKANRRVRVRLAD